MFDDPINPKIFFCFKLRKVWNFIFAPVYFQITVAYPSSSQAQTLHSIISKYIDTETDSEREKVAPGMLNTHIQCHDK